MRASEFLSNLTESQSETQSMDEGAEFGAYYYEQLAQKVFDSNPELQSEDDILNAGFPIAVEDLGSKRQANHLLGYDEDFPSDFISAYKWLQKQQQHHHHVGEGEQFCEECGGTLEWSLNEHGKASRALCKSSRSNDDLGVSQLASCKSQGLRARETSKKHTIGNKRVKIKGKSVKGHKYGGPLPYNKSDN